MNESERLGEVIAALKARQEWIAAGQPEMGSKTWNLAFERSVTACDSMGGPLSRGATALWKLIDANRKVD